MRPAPAAGSPSAAWAAYIFWASTWEAWKTASIFDCMSSASAESPSAAPRRSATAASMAPPLALVELIPVFLEQLLGLVDHLVGPVPGIRQRPPPGVFLCVLLGVLDHPIDILVGEGGAAGDGHGLLAPGAEGPWR